MSSKPVKGRTADSYTTPQGHRIEFHIGQTVYIRLDPEQSEKQVTAIELRPFNSITYAVMDDMTETWHYGFQLSTDRDIVKATTGI